MADEAKCVAQFIQLLKNWLCDVRLGTVMEKNWALSVEQCWLQVLQFSVHLIHLLSILLGHSGFARIQKAVVDQTGSRPPNSDHNLFFFWFKFGLGRALELLLSPNTELVISRCHIQSTLHCTSNFNREIVHCCCII